MHDEYKCWVTVILTCVFFGTITTILTYTPEFFWVVFVIAPIPIIVLFMVYRNGDKQKVNPCTKFGMRGVFPDSEYNNDQLKMGVEVEMEHTTNREMAKCIAKHHLGEQIDKGIDQDYYTKLKKIDPHD